VRLQPLSKLTNKAAEPVPVHVQTRSLDIVEIIENNVPDSTEVDVFTVPANRRLIITDLIISTSGTNAREARILRDGAPATSFLPVLGNLNAFSHTFATGIHFVAGETVKVSSGPAGGGSVHFYLRGFLV